MGNNGFESEKKAEKKEMDSTSQEANVMLRYVDLRANAYNALMNSEEQKDFAQNLIDLVKTLNAGVGISSDFREDLLGQIRRIEEGHLRLQKAVEAVKQLERESRAGILVPHLYDQAVTLVKTAMESGVPDRSLEPLHKSIREYLYKVRSYSK